MSCVAVCGPANPPVIVVVTLWLYGKEPIRELCLMAACSNQAEQVSHFFQRLSGQRAAVCIEDVTLNPYHLFAGIAQSRFGSSLTAARAHLGSRLAVTSIRPSFPCYLEIRSSFLKFPSNKYPICGAKVLFRNSTLLREQLVFVHLIPQEMFIARGM